MEATEVPGLKSQRGQRAEFGAQKAMVHLIYGTNDPFHRKENHGCGEQTCGCQVEGEEVGWTGNLGLIDVNYCFWNG